MKVVNLKLLIVLLAALVTSLLNNNPLFAQANFAGGKGGGYGLLEVKTDMTSVGDELNTSFEATIFPNPIEKNQVLRVRLNGVEQKSKVKIVISDMIGFQVFVQEMEVTTEFDIHLPYEKLTKGIYLISFQYSKNKITRRLSYLG